MNAVRRKIIENRVFAGMLVVVTVLFAVILRPFWGAIFWAGAMTIIFFPVQRRMLRHFGGRSSVAAAVTLIIGFVVVILPTVAFIYAFVQEGTRLYEQLEGEDFDPATLFDRAGRSFPIIPDVLQNFGIDTGSIRQALAESATSIGQWMAQQALNFGQKTFQFLVNLLLMLYLSFFLLRDGQKIILWMRRAAPMGGERTQMIFDKFVGVTRATIKGNLVIAVVEGLLGGFIFLVLGLPGPALWAVVMAFVSLIPALGTFVVWVPAAIWLASGGDWNRAIILSVYGVLVLGLADNLLRPWLVGRDTKLPDYMVLFSTLGGLMLIGINGFVIGPLLAALFVSCWSSFSRDLHNPRN